MDFFDKLQNKLLTSLKNNFGSENYDIGRFGEPPSEKSIKNRVKDLISKDFDFSKENAAHLRELILHQSDIFSCKDVFDILEDENSKNLYIELIAFRLLGYKKVRLSRNSKEYWKILDKIEHQYKDNSDSIDVDFENWKLSKFVLPAPWNLKLYFTTVGVQIDFFLQQYAYKDIVLVEKGDIVIDGGGCWGDTALYFSKLAGNMGKVYSYEFIPSNLRIFDKNLELNQDLNKNIEIVKAPLWDISDIEVYCIDNGPGSRVTFDKFDNPDKITRTQSIDDLVELRNLETVDFIKMDIEGAEMNALLGAKETISKFKPKLAIAIYHSWSDFHEIPKFIKSIRNDYKFYFDHYTIHKEESVIYAI